MRVVFHTLLEDLLRFVGWWPQTVIRGHGYVALRPLESLVYQTKTEHPKMMGHSHVISGAVTWTATAAVMTPASLGMHGTAAVVGGVAAGGLVAAGAALGADLDTQESTATYSLPPVTTLLAACIGLLAGGHRKGTHSLVGLAVFVFGAYALSWWSVTVAGTEYAPGPAVAAVLLAALAFKGLRARVAMRKVWGVALLAGVAVWFLTPHTPVDAWTFSSPSWFVIAIGVGYATHLIGDSMTDGGIPVFWPLPWKLYIPLIPHTSRDSVMEHIVLGIWVAIAVIVSVIGFSGGFG